MKDSEQFEFTQLYEKLLNETATELEISTLEEAIMSDPEALKLYQDLSHQHCHLSTTKANDAEKTLQARKADKKKAFITTITAYTAVAAAIALSLILLFQTEKPNRIETAGKNDAQDSYAKITATSLAQWGQCSLPTRLSSELSQGSLELLHGTATLSFHSGAIITLEAPAEIEIISEMKAVVKHGRVVADVPEPAIGFRLDTPNMEVKDLGTVFAVSVDREHGESQVDVIDGEVEIYHASSQDRKLLTQKQRASINQESDTVNYSSFSEITRSYDNNTREKSKQFTISTAQGKGGHASIISTHASTHLYPDLLQAKYSINGSYSRKFYLQFDLTELLTEDFQHVALKLNQVRSPYGFASFVPDCEFNVYALNDEAQEDWNPKTINWKNAPANVTRSGAMLKDSEATIIGTFRIPKGQQEGTCIIKSDQLVQLVKQDTNGVITLIVTRITKENHPEGLVHTFAGNNTQNASPPELIFITEK